MISEIEKEIKKYNFNIEEIEKSEFLEEESKIKYEIYTIELKENFRIEDYQKLILIEKEISKKLDLFQNKIILELL